MTDKLPEWPRMNTALAWFGVDEPGAICELEEQTRQIEFWESRCRLAVEALDQIRSFMANIGDAEYAAENVLKAIGPLPEKQP